MIWDRLVLARQVFGLSLLGLFHTACWGGDFDVVYLGGQSNMEGFGRVDEWSGQEEASDGAYIFHVPAATDQQPLASNVSWLPLRLGHGTDYKVTDQGPIYSGRFGVEMSLASEWRRARPDRKLAIIKYARNGSSIHQDAARKWGCWEPDFQAESGEHHDINQYDHFLATIRMAMTGADIDGDAQPDTLNPIGIVWMQGESDAAVSEEIAKDYERNLKRLMDLMRAALRQDDLPVVIGRISDSGQGEQGKTWPFGDAVREAQAAFVANDPSAKLITTTDDYGYSDPWHYDSAGYIDLGQQFARALIELNAN